MKPVRSVERALTILSLMAKSDEPIGVSDLSRSVSIDKATVLRLLATLEGFGLVQQDATTRRYFLGPNVALLATSWRLDLREVARPFLKSLWRQTSETVCLVCPRGLDRIYVDIFPGTHVLSVVPAVGSAVPIHAGASGKVLLAYSPEDWVAQVIDATRLKPLTSVGITAPAELYRELHEVRRRGFGYSSGDVTQGTAAVAAPIFNRQGEILAAVVVRGPTVRLTEDKLIELGPRVREIGEQISAMLGFSGVLANKSRPAPKSVATAPHRRSARRRG
jgi:DNA-binding IclR family transcriptional regulator